MKKLLLLLILFFGLCYSQIAACENFNTEEARDWAQNKGEQILLVLADKNLEQKYAKLDEILYTDVDLDYAARFVVGRYWRQMSEQQKEEYVPLFKRYTAALYKSFPLDVSEGSVNYQIEKVQQNKIFMDVFCSIGLNNENQKNSGKIPVIFSLVKNDGKIMVRDLKIAESSLLLTYRERFYKMIHQDNDDEIEWFLEDLETITKDKETENEHKL